MPERNITFEIREHIGVITRYESGWNKELNIISWNGGTAKYDLRDWDPHHERMKRGITLFDTELRKLIELYFSNNSQKAIERGQAIEAERRARQQAQKRGSQGSGSQESDSREESGEPTFEQAQKLHLQQVEAEAFEGALPPGEEAETDANSALQPKEEAEVGKDAVPF